MLADIYIGSALAIFLAVLGWSETIFGLSQRTKEKEAEFIRRAGLTLANYVELRKLVLSTYVSDQGEYTKSLMRILRNSNIKSGDKQIIDNLKNNGSLLSNLEKWILAKKIVALLLFLYLYVAGTYMLIMENSLLPNQITSLNQTTIIFQIILLLFVGVSLFIYVKTSGYEKNIQLNLNSLIIKVNGAN